MNIIKISGSRVDDAELLQDIAKHTPAIVVHGGGPQLDLALQAQGPVQRIAGQRVTSVKGAAITQWTLDGVGERLAGALAGHAPTRHVGATTRWLGAEPMHEALQRVGKVTTVQREAIRPNDGEIVVATPVGFDEHGPLNVNADVAAAQVAVHQRADVLHMVTDVDGVLDEDGRLITTMSAGQARGLIDSGVANGGMIPKLQSAIEAIEAGVGRVRIGGLGTGTEITA